MRGILAMLITPKKKISDPLGHEVRSAVAKNQGAAHALDKTILELLDAQRREPSRH